MDTYHTRWESRAAAERATWLAHEAALGRRTELSNTLDAGVRVLRALKDQGASKEFLHDTAAGLRDQVSNLEAAIDKDLDDQGGLPEGAVDMAELNNFLAEVK